MKSLKSIVVLCVLVILQKKSLGQTFHFNDTITYFVKEVDSSSTPLHWYLEIFNDLGQDTTLRWKADFSTIPVGWTISFDDQTTFHTSVMHQDSADFTLLAGSTFPQKLIIGNNLNGISGAGSAIFKIYDPNVPEVFQNIEYKFIITEGGKTGIDEEVIRDQLKLINNKILFPLEVIGCNFQLITLNGSVLKTGKIDKSVIELNNFGNGIYCLVVYHPKMTIAKKISFMNH